MLKTLRHLLTPHHTNNHRARLLHPAGLSVLIGIFAIAQVFITNAASVFLLPQGMVLGFASNIDASEVISLTNSERSSRGIETLTLNASLSQAAFKKAQHMFEQDYWAHIAPDGTTPWQFIRGSGYNYSVAGENLARDFHSTGPMVKAWMDSPTHKENIVNPRYSEIGVAVVDGRLGGVETTLVVQMFGTLSPAVAQTTEQAAQAPQVEPQPVLTDPDPVPQTQPQTQTETQPETQPIVQESQPPQELVASAPNLPSTVTLGQASRINLGNAPIGSRLSPLFINKVLAATIILLLASLLIYDVVYIHQRQIPRVVGRTWAHMSFFGLILLLVLISQQGVIY